MKMFAWSKLAPVVIFAAMLASACATADTGQGGGGNPYGSGGPAQGGSAGSMSGGGSMSSGASGGAMR